MFTEKVLVTLIISAAICFIAWCGSRNTRKKDGTDK